MGKIAQGSGRAGGNGASFPGRGRAAQGWPYASQIPKRDWVRGVRSPRPSGVHVGTGSVPARCPRGEMEVAGESAGTDLCVGPNTFCCGRRSRADNSRSAPDAGWEVFRTTQASGAQRSVCGAGAREWAGIGAGITPSGTINAGQSLSQPAAASSLSHKGALGTGDADCRVASLRVMTVLILCHSEEAQRADVGIRSFLRWTGIGPPSRRPLRVVAGSPPRLPGQRLAKRKARKEQLVKFDFCPMTELCSTAQKVRKSQQGPARAHAGAAITEQDSLAPHPAAREGAPRP